MNLNDFDDILKQKLNEMPVEHSTPDWDRMNRELDEDSVKDQIFDEQINRKLKQLNVHNFARPNWNGLYELIDRRIQNKRRVIVNKSFEIIAVLLLFFTAFNLGIYTTNNAQPGTLEQDNQVPAIYAEANLNSEIKSKLSINPDQEIQNTAFDNSSQNISSQNNNAENNRFQNNTTVNSVNGNSIDKVRNRSPRSYESTTSLIALNSNLTNSNNPILPISNIKLELNTTSLASNQTLSSSDSEGSFTVNQVKEIPNEIMSKAFPKDFSTLKLDQLNLSNLDETVALHELSAHRLQSPKHSNWFVSASASFNTNSIESASYKLIAEKASTTNRNDQVYGEEIKNAYNTAAALNFGYALGKMELTSGFEFQRLKYSPWVGITTGELSSLTDTYIEDIQYDFISIPLELNAAVYSKNTWKARIHAGAIASFLLEAKETVSQQIRRGSKLIDVAEDDVDVQLLGFTFPEGALSTENQHGKSQKLSEFVRYKANIGISLSKRISNRSEIFGRTDFQYQIPGTDLLDTNIDLINTLSFSFGVKQFLG